MPSEILPPLPDATDLVEKPVSATVVYEGRVITVRNDEAELPDGKIRPRDVVLHPGGVVVLPVLEDGRIIFIQQYRYVLGQPLLELPAGKLDPPELPDAAVRRELREETGYDAAHWEQLTAIFTSPGFCDERLWLYKATGLTPAENIETTDDEECIQRVLMTPEEARIRIRRREIVDAKSIVLFSLVYGL